MGSIMLASHFPALAIFYFIFISQRESNGMWRLALLDKNALREKSTEMGQKIGIFQSRQP